MAFVANYEHLKSIEAGYFEFALGILTDVIQLIHFWNDGVVILNAVQRRGT